MRADFQEEILKYILQTKEGKKYVQYLDKELWDIPQNQVIFDLLKGYMEKFKGHPTKVTLIEFFDRELRKSKEKISKETYTSVERSIFRLYDSPFDGSSGLIHEEIIEYAQRKLTKKLFREKADGISTGDDRFFDETHKEMRKIADLKRVLDFDNTKNRGGFALAEFEDMSFADEVDKAHPTFLDQLNDLTAEGGFYNPQLVIFMKGPKAFGTGLLLNLAKGWVRDGLKIYFADTENGITPIKKRFYQALAECTRKELRDSDIKRNLAIQVRGYKAMGGDFYNSFFPAGQGTLDDVDADLEDLRDNHGWVPDVIIYDYLDLFKGPDPKKDKRLQIQDNYHKAVALNVKWGTFAVSISTVSRSAIDKEVIKVTDFGEDIQKAYNCHAAFAICATDKEAALNIARILPVAQREGVGFKGKNVCPVFLDQANMQVRETTMQELINLLDGREKSNKPKKPIRDD